MVALDAHAVLKTYFGYDCFREGQLPVVQCLLSGRDAMVVMPTGAGKSICFQVPALLMPGITLVISPLISLMKDQVSALVAAGVPAAFFNSSLTEAQYSKALSLAYTGKYKIIYVAPERLTTERFQRFAQTMPISMVAVDEAHCVSQWGQDFRPSYLGIADFVDALPQRPVTAAFTATATQQVKDDILHLLRLQRPLTMTTGFNRPNLYFGVLHAKAKFDALLEIIDAHDRQAGMIYCATRKTVEDVCQKLCDAGYAATRYHAGLDLEERRRNQEDFLYDRAPLMVATNAFGMGIDKSDVRFVVHYNMPGDMESYYQEAGRAGRDGESADCLLLFSAQDVKIREFMIEHSSEEAPEMLDENLRAALRERDYARLRVMERYCRLQSCLRRYILQYFGEIASDCGNCSGCRNALPLEDITAEAQEIVRCVSTFGGRFGLTTYLALLRGTKNASVDKYELDYDRAGCLAPLSEAAVRRRIEWLIEQEILEQTTGEYPRVRLGAHAKELLDGIVIIRMPGTAEPEAEKSGKQNRKTAKPAAVGGPLNDEAKNLYERLREVRLELARARGVPAYVIFSDATLRGIAQAMPRTEAELLAVNGVGEAKLRQYGHHFLAAVREEL